MQRGENHHHELLTNETVLRWMVAAAVAVVALVGFLGLIVATMLYISVPAWVMTAITIALVTGFCVYAWVLAAAMRDRDD